MPFQEEAGLVWHLAQEHAGMGPFSGANEDTPYMAACAGERATGMGPFSGTDEAGAEEATQAQ